MPGIVASRAIPSEPRHDQAGEGGADPFLSFHSEKAAVAVPSAPPQAIASEFPHAIQPVSLAPITIGLVVGLAGIATAGALYFLQLSRPAATLRQIAALAQRAPAPTPPQTDGTVTISSRPEGAQVLVAGTARGVTPLRLSLPLGNHVLELRNGTAQRKLPVTIEAGKVVSQYVDLAPIAMGTLVIESALDLQVMENGRLLGSTRNGKLTLSTGRHDLELVGAALGFRSSVTVQVVSGKTTTITPASPNGSLSVNALPWADVWLDGRELGTTPLGNVSVPIGQHEILWKHPQLGERRQTITVTARSPVRVGVDLRR